MIKRFKSVQILFGTLFIMLSAIVQFNLPFSPIPITLHTLAITVLAALWPLEICLLCFSLYVLEGFTGSIFLHKALSIGPSFGYLVGMLVAILWISIFKSKGNKALYLLIAYVWILGFGALHLQGIIGGEKALKFGVYPFIPGGILKGLIAYFIIKKMELFRSDLPAI